MSEQKVRVVDGYLCAACHTPHAGPEARADALHCCAPEEFTGYQCVACDDIYEEPAEAENCSHWRKRPWGIEIIATDVAPLMRVSPEARALVDAYLEAGEADFIAIEVEGDVIPWEDDV